MHAGAAMLTRAESLELDTGATPRPTAILGTAWPFDDRDDQIPDPPERLVRSLAAQAFEVVEGVRNIAQLGALISVGAARQLASQRTALKERRQVYQDQRTCIPSPGRVHMCRVLPHLAEASVVLHTEHRSHAVALRLEWVHRRWRACELYVM